MMTARDIVRALGGRWHGRYGIARCPAHDDREPSFSVRHMHDGPALHCFAGCAFKDIVRELKSRGIWDETCSPDSAPRIARPDPAPDRAPDRALDEARRTGYARALWDRAVPISGTRAETYLKARGIALPPVGTAALRYLPRLKHAPTGRAFPCMIAALTDGTNRLVAVQRTYLSADGTAKAPVMAAKMTVGPMGHAAVKLFEPHGDTLALAEGIETALSAYVLHFIPVWATAGAERLSKVAIPPRIRRLVIFADEGGKGRTAAADAARVYRRRGFDVDVVAPSAEFGDTVEDFNDVLQQRAGL
jgi:hypothetical protein